MEFDLIAINLEFQKLLKKHENDTEVTGVDKKAFEEVTCDEKESIRKFWAMAYNAYEELCNKHQGLRDTYGWYAGADGAGYPNPYDLYIGTEDEEEQRRPKRKNLVAANNKAFDGDNDYWPFLTKFMTDYDHSDRIAEIVDIEKELDEHLATMDEQRFNESREELRRLTLLCLDEALCNYINKKYPGAVAVGA